MTRRRWMADEVSGKRAVLLGAHAAHLVKVLRARLGQQFDIACGSAVRKGTIVSLAPERIEFELAESVATTPVPELTLLLSVFKFDRMEWAIEKCVELGTAHIIPTISSRTESHLASAAIKRSERWKRIASQAAEQSRRAALPEISGPLKLAEAVKRKDGLR